MKKVLIAILVIILIIISVLIVTPLLFREQILQKAREVANSSVNANVDFRDFRLNLFRDFPRLSVSLQDVSIVNREPFAGDTLVAFKEFKAAVDLMSIVKKDAIKVRSILLDRPVLNGIILEDGTANWDITMPSEETEPEEVDTLKGDTMDLKIALKKFEIRSANITYDDRASNMKASADNLNFLLYGDLSQDFSSLSIQSEIEKMNFIYDGVKYLRDAVLKMIINVDANLANSVYTLKENNIALNALELRFDGKVALPDDETISLDLTFDTPSTGFKSLLSMVPAIYMKDFQDIKADGMLSLKGAVSGILKGEITPSADLELIVDNARFSYPDLPKSAEKININVKAHYDGVQNDNSTVDINLLQADIGGNPLDMKIHLITPISDPQVNAQVIAKIDFSTITDVLPLEGINIAGRLDADIDMMGKMSSIVNERYEEFKANGNIRLQNFELTSQDVPHPVFIQQTLLNFTPQFVQLEAFDGKIGSSDIHLKGKLENFIPYILADGILHGSLDFNSDLIDVNEFMGSDEEAEQVVVEDTTELTVFEVPGNIDFTLSSKLKKIKYDKIEIDNVDGLILLKDKKILLTNLSMNLLQGSMVMSGEYNTQNISTPFVDFKLDIRSIDIPSAFNTFNTVRQLVPVAERAKGNLSTSLSITSFLDQNMTPVMNTLVGMGRLMSSSVEINNSKTFEKIGNLLKSDRFEVLNLNDLDIDFEVRNGRVYVKPFDVKIGQNKLNISGDQGIDLTMNYVMQMAVPKSQLGSGIGSALDGLTSMAAQQGMTIEAGENVDVSFLVGGTFLDPQVKPVFAKGTALKEQLKEDVKERVEEKVDAVKEDVKEEVNKQAEQILKEAEENAQKVRDEAKRAGEELVKAAYAQGQKLIKDAGTNPIKKRLAEESAKKLLSEAEAKAAKLEEEADRRADQILQEAREKADQLK
jgi:uncharacterized protein involved in outer membrane biogenesis